MRNSSISSCPLVAVFNLEEDTGGRCQGCVEDAQVLPAPPWGLPSAMVLPLVLRAWDKHLPVPQASREHDSARTLCTSECPVRNHPLATKARPEPAGGRLRSSEGATQAAFTAGCSDSASILAREASAGAGNCCRFLFLCLYSGQDIEAPRFTSQNITAFSARLANEDIEKAKPTPSPSPNTTPGSPQSPKPSVLLQQAETAPFSLVTALNFIP